MKITIELDCPCKKELLRRVIELRDDTDDDRVIAMVAEQLYVARVEMLLHEMTGAQAVDLVTQWREEHPGIAVSDEAVLRTIAHQRAQQVGRIGRAA